MKALVIAGTNSGCGKTIITLGLLRALANRKLKVQPFKAGPDYIDTAWHTKVAGVTSRNLDGFMLGDDALLNAFAQQAQQADISIIEGVMGMYDGYGNDPYYCSSAGLAATLDCPVILIVDGKAVSTSAAATVMGFQAFSDKVNIAGVIVNHVSSEGHFDLLKTAIETYCGVPVLGRLPKMPDIELPSRHLGLTTARESTQFDSSWDQLAEVVEAHIDLDKLLEVVQLTTPVIAKEPAEFAQSGQGLTVAVAYDQAFNFYYQDNLDLLQRCGASITYFSPMNDEQLPDCDMVYLGGGFPELHAHQLASNRSMLASLKRAHERRIPIYAECGGLMYLGEGLIDQDNHQHSMVGVLPGTSQMTKSLKRFGYCYAKATQNTLLCDVDSIIRGHEFHYSEFTTALEPAFSLYKERDGEILSKWKGGYQLDNTLASYLHVHFAQNPQFLLNWFKRARQL
ncbi:cobyrinate a,c-diamide synthase [Vibrio sp. AK197]